MKIVITNEIEELITPNIFYTAITRAKDKLKIYWAQETEPAVLSTLEARNDIKDEVLLTVKYELQYVNFVRLRLNIK